MSYGEGVQAREYDEGEVTDVRRGGQIEQALDELDEALRMLSTLVEDETRSKLDPILRPSEPRPEPGDMRDAKLAAVRRTSALADRVLAARNRARHLVGVLGETLERVDL